jgi:hypothetical protein
MRRQVVGIGLLVAALGGTVGAIAPAASAATATAKPAKFKGTWSISGGLAGFYITKESKTTGVCKGTSFDAPLYQLIDCQVTGHKYKFTITEGNYQAYNSGTFKGNSLSGRFTDTNGTTESYTGTRTPLPPRQ